MVDLMTGALHTLQDAGGRTQQHANAALSSHLQQQQTQQQQHGQASWPHVADTASLIQPTDCGLISQRLWAPAPDGTAVPLTLLHQQGAVHDGTRPLLVEVYGAYGHSLEADFKPHRLPLLHRGWSVALAHVRGGGELGRRCVWRVVCVYCAVYKALADVGDAVLL